MQPHLLRLAALVLTTAGAIIAVGALEYVQRHFNSVYLKGWAVALWVAAPYGVALIFCLVARSRRALVATFSMSVILFLFTLPSYGIQFIAPRRPSGDMVALGVIAGALIISTGVIAVQVIAWLVAGRLLKGRTE
jgi:hypothetical protein